MTTYRRLRRLFENISFAALAAQASGCSDTSLNSGFDLTVPCDEPSVLAGAQQVVAGDYLAIRRAYLPNLDGAPPPPPYMVAEAGVACATASEPDACATALATIPADPGWGHDVVFWPETHRARTQLIWTRGDEVGAVTNDAELRAFLGTIDDPATAWLVARFATGHSLVCEGPNARLVDGGVELITTSGWACGEGSSRSEHILVVAADGTATVRRSVVVEVGHGSCIIGRLTTDVDTPTPERHATLGGYFAEMAALEASAVTAFERLAQELEVLGAPADFVSRARQARDDERRHAAQVGELAQAYGAAPLEVATDVALPLRAALDVALENAREGCARETYGALVATYQAQRARDPRVAAVLTSIAKDETRHAALAWDLAAWLDGALSQAERAMVRTERAYALQVFSGDATHVLTEEARAAAGLPDQTMARALFGALHAQLWA